MLIYLGVRFMRELRHPGKIALAERTFFQRDMLHVYNIVDENGGGKMLTDLCFQQFCAEQGSVGSFEREGQKKAKIKKKEVQVDKREDKSTLSSAENLELKCRFVDALLTLERHGILKLKGAIESHSLIHIAMYSWI